MHGETTVMKTSVSFHEVLKKKNNNECDNSDNDVDDREDSNNKNNLVSWCFKLSQPQRII